MEMRNLGQSAIASDKQVVAAISNESSFSCQKFLNLIFLSHSVTSPLDHLFSSESERVRLSQFSGKEGMDEILWVDDTSFLLKEGSGVVLKSSWRHRSVCKGQVLRIITKSSAVLRKVVQNLPLRGMDEWPDLVSQNYLYLGSAIYCLFLTRWNGKPKIVLEDRNGKVTVSANMDF